MFELPQQHAHSKWRLWSIVSIVLFLCAFSGALVWYFLFYLSPPEHKDVVENITNPVIVETKKNEIKKEEVITLEFSSTTIIMVGDIMLDRDVYSNIKKNKNDFNELAFAWIINFPLFEKDRS